MATTPKFITTENRINIVNYYLSKPCTISEVADKFKCSNPTVIKILNEFNVKRWKKARLHNPSLREDFFSNIDSEAKAYFLGLILTDGNVFHEKNGNRQSSISITLNAEDSYLLDEFKTAVNAETSMSSDGRGCNYVAVRSDIMARDLYRYGVVPRKSCKEINLPSVSDSMMPHLVRGILDGDGSVLHSKNWEWQSIVFCGSHTLMQDISNLYSHMGANTKPKVYDYKDKPLSQISFGSRHDVIAVGEWTYRDATIFMKRKRDKFIEIYNFLHGNTEVTS